MRSFGSRLEAIVRAFKTDLVGVVETELRDRAGDESESDALLDPVEAAIRIEKVRGASRQTATFGHPERTGHRIVLSRIVVEREAET